jgi:predicted short-subunit dehydrogenase-like oxidoreductase (DUF2520 family)
MASNLLQHIGFEKELALELIMPLAQGTLQNVKEFNIESSLTGPLIRGDLGTVKEHLKALGKFPVYRQAYMQLARQALEIAQQKKIPPEKIKALKNLLEGK